MINQRTQFWTHWSTYILALVSLRIRRSGFLSWTSCLQGRVTKTPQLFFSDWFLKQDKTWKNFKSPVWFQHRVRLNIVPLVPLVQDSSRTRSSGAKRRSVGQIDRRLPQKLLNDFFLSCSQQPKVIKPAIKRSSA